MLENHIESKVTLFADGVHTELRAQENRRRWLTLVQGNLASNRREETSGVSARVYKNGVYGFSSMSENSGDAAEAVLNAATENALFMDGHIKKGKGMFPALEKGTVSTGEKLLDLEQKRYIEFAKEIDAYIEKTYPKLASRYVMVNVDSMEKRMPLPGIPPLQL